MQKYEPGICGNLLAEVAAQTTARLGGEVRALAVSSDKIGSGESSRRAPSEEERASALEVARAVYGQRRVGAALIRKMKTVNLTATDIERDGPVRTDRDLPDRRGKRPQAQPLHHLRAERRWEVQGGLELV